MRLSAYLRPDLVITHLRAGGAREAIAVLARALAERGVVSSHEEVEAGLLAREETHTTAMGQGLALPHATLEGLDRPVLMVAVAEQPVAFGPEGSEPVSVFFVLLSPPGHEREHIKMLARICRLARHAGFLESLQAAATSEEAFRILERVDAEHV